MPAAFPLGHVASAATPAEVLAVVARGGERTIESTLSLFAMLGLDRPRSGETRLQIPASFLLGLGVTLRLYGWEKKGFRVHRDHGLPPSAEPLEKLVQATSEPSWEGLDRFVKSLLSPFMTAHARFATQGRELLGAEVALGEPDEDALLDALAQLCWANRERRKDHGKAD